MTKQQVPPAPSSAPRSSPPTSSQGPPLVHPLQLLPASLQLLSLIYKLMLNMVERTSFLTHGDARAPATAVTEGSGKSGRTLRWIEPETRWSHLDVVVCIAAGTTRLCLKNSPPIGRHRHRPRSLSLYTTARQIGC